MRKKIRFSIKTTLFTLTVLLGIFLRLWKLNEFPAGLNADEAAIGYNAYSLILTGKDEYGTPWPVHFKSFADFKPGGYFYLVFPFVKFFGLSEWSVRLPSALIGPFSILAIFLLTRSIFNNFWISLLSSLLLAISPWHIHFSRGGWETNVATFFITLGVFFFLEFLKQKKTFLFFSFFFFLAAIYTYHSARVVVPLLGLFLLIFFRKEILKNWKICLLSFLVTCIFAFPLIKDFLSPAVSARFSGVGLLADVGPFWQANSLRGEHSNPNSLLVKILHNRPVTYGLRFLSNYFSHFSGEFLFISGDKIKRSNAPEMGEMYLFDLFFLIAGFYFLAKQHYRFTKVLLIWLFIAPIPASFTFQSPHALRAHNLVIPLIVISACGLYQLLTFFQQKFSKYFPCIVVLAFLIISFNVSYFLHQYFVHYPKEYPDAWEYGFKELVDFLKPIKDNYQKIYVTDKYDQPYILFLFYLKYPPQSFQKEAVLTPRDKFGFSTVRDFANFHFEEIKWDSLKDQSNVLIIGTDQEIPKEVSKIKTIYFKNFQPAFQIVAK